MYTFEHAKTYIQKGQSQNSASIAKEKLTIEIGVLTGIATVHRDLGIGGGLVALIVAGINDDGLAHSDHVAGAEVDAILLGDEAEEVERTLGVARGSPGALDLGDVAADRAGVGDGVAVLDGGAAAVLGGALDGLAVVVGAGDGAAALDLHDADGLGADLVLVGVGADEAVGHGGIDLDGGLVAGIDAGVGLLHLAEGGGLAGAEGGSVQQRQEVLGIGRSGRGHGTGALQLADVSAGLADVLDGVAVLNVDHVLPILAVLGGWLHGLLALRLGAIGHHDLAGGLDVHLASGLDAEVVHVGVLAGGAVGHLDLGLDGGLVAHLLAGGDGLLLADLDGLGGTEAETALEAVEQVLGGGALGGAGRGRRAGAVGLDDGAALLAGVGDGVAVGGGAVAALLRTLGGDVLALDLGAIGHGDFAGAFDLEGESAAHRSQR